jgi:hypothetical protein
VNSSLVDLDFLLPVLGFQLIFHLMHQQHPLPQPLSQSNRNLAPDFLQLFSAAWKTIKAAYRVKIKILPLLVKALV